MSAHKDPSRVAAGLKASIHNPNVSEEAKERAADRLEKMQDQTHHQTRNGHPHHQPSTGEHDVNRVLGGYKATLSNQHTSDKARAHAREVLEAAGYTFENVEGVSDDEHQVHVLAGYKAALNNPRVSEAAKEHAREYLEAHGAL